ncbi:MAG: hypothetical protein RTU63_06040 [Candidatus Thorarchaeota archaeon]
MSEEEGISSVESESTSAKQIGFYFTILAFYAPAFVLIGGFNPLYPSFSVWGMLWWLRYHVELGGWYLDIYWPFFVIGQSIIHTCLRPVFAYQMMRLYQGKADRRQTLLVGLFIELQALIVDVPMLLLSSEILYSIHIPIPLLLIAAAFVMRFKPPLPRTISWIEKEKEDSEWWSPKKDDDAISHSSEVISRVFRKITSNKVLETILAAEVILLIIGGLIVSNLDSWQYRAYYALAVPWFILITGLLFLMTRPMKERSN